MPVQMRGGRMYNTVQERLKAAHGDELPVGIKSIVSEPISLPTIHGALVAVKATVTFANGQVFTGLAEVPLDAQGGAEKTNPVEVGETSAVGRALAMAGYYGSEEGLAGAEEMREAQRRTNLPPRNAPSGRMATAQIPDEIAQDTQRMQTNTPRQADPSVPAARPGYVTVPQVRLISGLLKSLGEPMPPDINEFSVKDASALIEQLQQRGGKIR